MKRRIVMVVSGLLCSVLWVGATVTKAESQASPRGISRELPAAKGPEQPLGSEHDLSGLTPLQRNFVRHLLAVPIEQRRKMCLCVAPDTPQEYIDLLNEIMYPDAGLRYEQTSRWPGSQGDPISLAYSFVPDGVAVPANAGLSGGTNQIHALFNGIFGTPATWQGLFAQALGRWESLSGITYQMVGDDGASLFGSPGSAARGDVRISAIPLDGANGVLAYNNFPLAEFGTPGGGDMVLDANDGSNWGNAANNHRFLRNVITHEHGHGIGLMHVCPSNGTKLMEPSIILSFDGPQHDDTRAVQRHYGDAYEHNDTAATATNLGTINAGTADLVNVSADDNSDVDYYAFTVSGGRKVSATMTPVGFNYDSGAQVFIGCLFSFPSPVNSLTINNLDLTLLDTDGSTVLFSANTQPAGQAESFSNYALPGPGMYYLHVQSATATDDVQLYDLSLTVTSTPGTGDFDVDGDVDLADFAAFQRCFGPLTVGCEEGDFDADGTVDLLDYANFASVQTGP